MDYSREPGPGGSSRRDCTACLARDFGLCEAAESPRALPVRALPSRDRNLNAGTVVLRQGEPGPHVYLLRDGWIALNAASDVGTSAMLDIMLPGDMVGLLSESGHDGNHSAVCLTDVAVTAIPRSVLMGVAEQCPHLGQRLLHHMAMQLARAHANARNVISRPAEDRIVWFFANLFFRLRQRPPSRREAPVPVPLGLGGVGDALGLTTVHVCRMLRRLREQDILRFERRILYVLNGTAMARSLGLGAETGRSRTLPVPAILAEDRLSA